MTAQLLARKHHRSRPEHSFLEGLSLPLSCCHEFCGNARRTLAMIVAGSLQGPVFWITPDWVQERLHPDGMAPFAEPGRFTFITPPREEDILWCMEEILRSGAVGLVIAEVSTPPALTPVRRLHLAAEAGGDKERAHPLALLLNGSEGGAQGVESRWHMAGTLGRDAPSWILTRTHARAIPPKSWHVARSRSDFSVTATAVHL